MFERTPAPDASDRAAFSPVLLVAAAPREAEAIARGFNADPPAHPWQPTPLAANWSLVRSGVGKADAAGATAAALTQSRFSDTHQAPARERSSPPRPAVVSVGIAGALPGPDEPDLLTTIVATRSIFADEGLTTPAGFQSLADMGFAPSPELAAGIPADPALARALAAGLNARSAPIATVSSCSGTDAAAAEVAARTGAIAEAMEGAAVGLATRRLAASANHPAFAEVRVISNTTGNRDRQRWNLDAALATLEDIARQWAHAASQA